MSYSQEQRDYVYSIWSMQGDRNAEKTARLVLTGSDAGEIGISELTSRTIRNWVRDEGWNDRAYRDIYAVAPELRFQAQATLALASPEAAAVLREAINQSCMVERHFIVKNADGSTEVESRMEFDVNLFKAKVQAAQVALDRTGFSPVGTREQGVLDAPPSSVTELVSEISRTNDPEELLRIERSLRRELGMGTATIGIGQSHKTQENRGWESG